MNLDVAEDKITDLARERDDVKDQLETLRQTLEAHDALVDALFKSIRAIDAGQWAAHWPLRVRKTFDLVRNLLDEITNPINQREE